MIFEVSISTENREKCRKEMQKGGYCGICSNDCPYAWKGTKWAQTSKKS